MVNGITLKKYMFYSLFVHLSRPHTCFLVSSSWVLLAPLMLSSVSACHRTPPPAAQSRYHRLLHKRLSHSCCVHWTLCRADCWHILTHSVSDIMSNVTLAYCPQPTCNLDHDSKIINIELLTIDNVNMSITLLWCNKIWSINVLASAVHILKLERYRED